MHIHLIVIFSIAAEVFCEELPQVQLRKVGKLHEDTINDYQQTINALAQNIIQESKVLTEKINLATTLVKTKISDSISTMSADIKIVQKNVAQLLKNDTVKSNPNAKSCLKILQIRAASLNTKNIGLCYDKNGVKSLSKARDNVLSLKSIVVGLPRTCKKQHPLESDVSGMTLCLQMNLSYVESQKATLVVEANANINAFRNEAESCVINAEEDISVVTNDIPNQAEECTVVD